MIITMTGDKSGASPLAAGIVIEQEPTAQEVGRPNPELLRIMYMAHSNKIPLRIFEEDQAEADLATSRFLAGEIAQQGLYRDSQSREDIRAATAYFFSIEELQRAVFLACGGSNGTTSDKDLMEFILHERAHYDVLWARALCPVCGIIFCYDEKGREIIRVFVEAQILPENDEEARAIIYATTTAPADLSESDRAKLGE